MSHIQNLIALEPGLLRGRLLDIGAGRGEVLSEAIDLGIDARGIELNPTKVGWIREKVSSERITEGNAETLPYADASFEFLNMCELIEHVVDPRRVLTEAHRVLVLGGKAYISFPNRFSIYDTHYHVWFVNWLPRSMADWYIHFFGKQKTKGGIDLQQLSEMHYYTFKQFEKLVRSCGFVMEDVRVRRLKGRPIARALYFLVRPWFFRSSHVLLSKQEISP